MTTILHIITREEAQLARAVIAGQRALADAEVEVVELSSNPAPDYGALVEKIFHADAVEVW
jgi:hypothetical protein